MAAEPVSGMPLPDRTKRTPMQSYQVKATACFQIVDQTDSVRIGATQETQALAVVIAPGAPY